jgi:hypothetical protein
MDRETRIITPGEMLPYPPLPVLKPLVAFGLTDLININDVLYMAPKVRSHVVRNSRNKGYRSGLGVARALGIPEAVKPLPGKNTRNSFRTQLAYPVTRLPIFTILYVWHGRSKKDPALPARTQDVYNPLVKSFIDGLTDAGLWEDDNVRYHTDFTAKYMGLSDTNRYELAFFEITPTGVEED